MDDHPLGTRELLQLVAEEEGAGALGSGDQSDVGAERGGQLEGAAARRCAPHHAHGALPRQLALQSGEQHRPVCHEQDARHLGAPSHYTVLNASVGDSLAARMAG